jgi:hypothetical protein
VLIIGDENGDDSVSVSTYSQNQMLIKIQAKPTNRLLLSKLLKNQKSKHRHSLGIA